MSPGHRFQESLPRVACAAIQEAILAAVLEPTTAAAPGGCHHGRTSNHLSSCKGKVVGTLAETQEAKAQMYTRSRSQSQVVVEPGSWLLSLQS